LANPFRVSIRVNGLIPGLSLRSNPGLKLANAFGVIAVQLQTDALLEQITGNQHTKEITMSTEEREDNTIYKVVVNHEDQYSIWPADRENALGWNDAGKTGTKAECLAYIKEVWTDMRPLSLRKKMEAAAGK